MVEIIKNISMTFIDFLPNFTFVKCSPFVSLLKLLLFISLFFSNNSLGKSKMEKLLTIIKGEKW